MKAVVFHEFGSSDVLRLEELDDPRPGRGEVTVEVAACALNHLDVDVREGISPLPDRAAARPRRGGSRTDRRGRRRRRGLAGRRPGNAVPDGHLRPLRLLHDGPGVAVPRRRLHQLRSFRRLCRAACLLRLASSSASRTSSPIVDAAAVQLAFATAWHMLFTRGSLRPGETVLVNSVGSGIGSAAVQLAHMAGAYVIGNSSRRRQARAGARIWGWTPESTTGSRTWSRRSCV